MIALTPAGWSAGTMWPASSTWIHVRLPCCLNCAATAPAMVRSSIGLTACKFQVPRSICMGATPSLHHHLEPHLGLGRHGVALERRRAEVVPPTEVVPEPSRPENQQIAEVVVDALHPTAPGVDVETVAPRVPVPGLEDRLVVGAEEGGLHRDDELLTRWKCSAWRWPARADWPPATWRGSTSRAIDGICMAKGQKQPHGLRHA